MNTQYPRNDLVSDASQIPAVENVDDHVGGAIRALIADDSEAILSGLAGFLGTYADVDVVGVARDDVEAVAMTFELKPDVVVMDVQMPGQDGIEAARIIKRDMSDVGIIIFTVSRNYLLPSLEAGAYEFLQKDCDPKELVSALRRIAT
ncbi:MAG: response regulator transcription factor [Dehalococcoidia bacterium]